eukprot:CAMPEP_0116049898 /NCGR_PEP_ID=MMETSP0322-20121206/69_1 /TAXON_ID=163516 /ORGANISM="Leptocylindrus danicus var. apora, Strain B651" /LENGTH=484 /DNA_ID=CAMNT_0003532365 /DNA_START=225 /DNA_END=1679 /DNA_ORIENTATION=-
MKKRKIYPVKDASGLRIIQVAAFIRHGARTPWGPFDCWAGYDTDPYQSRWDCDLNTIMSNPINEKGNTRQSRLLFKKIYDGLDEFSLLSNELKGTCEVGQLIEQGYEQQSQNGVILQDAYIGSSASPSSQLFVESQDEGGDFTSVYFRSDDEQRTLMSGQTLLSSMFNATSLNTVVDLHTADKPDDILSPYSLEKACPRLHSLREIAESSKEYLEGKRNENAKFLTSLVEDDLKFKDPKSIVNGHVMDCQLTAICSDRFLPKAIDDFTHDNDDSNFTYLFDFGNWLYTFPFTFKDAMFAKQFTSFLWSDLLRRINEQKYKFLLYSGHDDTLIALLASLEIWDGAWPPYASMFVIEIYKKDGDSNVLSQTVFRLLFNGVSITHRLDNCHEELCDISVLRSHLSSMANLTKACDDALDSAQANNLEMLAIEVTPPVQIFTVVLIASVVILSFANFSFAPSGQESSLHDHSSIALRKDYGSVNPSHN